jgi:hypothetical protein
MNSKQLEQFINSCTLTFKAFDFDVHVTKSKANLWHFISSNPRSQRKYQVYCTADISKVRSLVQIAMRKIPKGSRLVVITNEFTPEDSALADEYGYTLVRHIDLKKYGAEMLEAKAREAA